MSMKKKNNNKVIIMAEDIRVVELFAGVGGFRLGLESANKRFINVWANQYEPNKRNQYAYDCYVSHYTNKNTSNKDIETVKDSVPDHDLLVGGFPCQDYSVASTGAKGIEGVKGVLWWSIRDIVEAKKPKMILLENVDRLLKSPTKQRGRDFAVILRCLTDLGYCVEWRVINAADYGNAQKRRRVFIYAVLEDEAVDSPKDYVLTDGLFAKAFKVDKILNDKKTLEFNISSDEYETLEDLSETFTNKFFNAGYTGSAGNVYTTEVTHIKINPIPLKDILENGKVDKSYFLSEDLTKWQYLKGAKKIARTNASGNEYFYSEGALSFPDKLDSPARTILTSESGINRSSHVVVDKLTDKLRLLTPIECERINGFPDKWTASGMTNRARYFVMGNALVVPLVKQIGIEIIKHNKDN